MPRTPGTPRPPLADLSPGHRNRIIGARNFGIPYSRIAEQENIAESTARVTVKNTPLRPGGISQPRGRPPSRISPRDARSILELLLKTQRLRRLN